jgi:hypothetical protein
MLGRTLPLAMADIVVFDHIAKTAGSTMRRVLYRVFGSQHVFLTTQPGLHTERVAELSRLLDEDRPTVRAVISHAGVGLHELLPARHRYRRFTILRDPVGRTVSGYFYALQRGQIPESVSLEEWLELDVLHAHNGQTGFLGGLHDQWHLHGEALTPEMFTPEVLERAKRNLLAYDVVGMTERFDETLLLLRHTFGWSSGQMLHQRANVGRTRAGRTSPTPAALEAVRAQNELDSELYEYATGIFERQLSERLRMPRTQASVFRGANAVYGKAYPVAYPPARTFAHLSRRMRRRAA